MPVREAVALNFSWFCCHSSNGDSITWLGVEEIRGSILLLQAEITQIKEMLKKVIILGQLLGKQLKIHKYYRISYEKNVC